MREFVVTLRSGHRVTVRAAHRVILTHDHQFVTFTDEVPTPDDPVPVALFNRDEVVSVVSRDHLVSEEKVAPSHVVGGDDGIPF